MADESLALTSAVNDVIVDHLKGKLGALRFAGAGTRVVHNPCALDCTKHSGIIDFQPEELVIKVRGGTRLSQLQSMLAEHGQQLAADIVVPHPNSTVAGAIAFGLDGSCRPIAGGLRDAMLGCQLINGLGERVSFGGQVMKNVAGYDFARLQVGAKGTLGLLLDVSLKLRPLAAERRYYRITCVPSQAHHYWKTCSALAPFYQGGFYHQNELVVCFAGRSRALQHVLGSLPESFHECNESLWLRHSHWQLSLYQADALACISLPEALAPEAWPAAGVLDWEARRLWLANGDHEQLRQWAFGLGGQISVLRGAHLACLPADQWHWHQAIKRAFDPHHLFNPVLFKHYFSPYVEPSCT